MFRNCFTTLNIVTSNLNRGSKYAVFKRHAGHSKWQNIKHTKASADASKALLVARMVQRVQIAVREGGPNPDLNRTLKNIIAEATKNRVPKETIERTIARASGEDGKPLTFCVKGPKNIIFAIDVFTHSSSKTKNMLTSVVKKFNFTVDQCKGNEKEFRRAGIIKCKPLKGSLNLDLAFEHAIEVNAEEVTEDEENNLVFQCSVDNVYRVKEKLEALGYDVTFADAVIQFNVHSALNDSEIEICEKFVTRLDEIPEIVKISDNIA